VPSRSPARPRSRRVRPYHGGDLVGLPILHREGVRYDARAGLQPGTSFTLYLRPPQMRLRPQLLAMKPGTRVVSHSFTMEDWRPTRSPPWTDDRAYFWVVPANVMGTCRSTPAARRASSASSRPSRDQRHRQPAEHRAGGLREARLRGPQIAFAYVDDKACGASSPAR